MISARQYPRLREGDGKGISIIVFDAAIVNLALFFSLHDSSTEYWDGP
jgi:hypothetical protein